MKKLFLIAVILIVCVWTEVAYCPPAPTPSQPVKGGILKCIRGAFPKVIGYPPEFGASDGIFAQLVIERLMTWDEKGNMIPVLADTWEGDPVNKTLTFYLKKGIKFHDGSDFNAEVARWNFQLTADAGRLPTLKSLEVVDNYTLKLYLKDYDRTVWETYGQGIAMISPTAFNNAGGGDKEKSKAWARTHPVGTGPFRLADFQRDVVIKYEKNENYWRKGMPYLAGIEIRCIPDNMTASAMMQAKEADMWLEPSLIQNVIDLEKKGFKINWGPGMLISLLPYSNDPNSPVADKNVRAAVKYALNRPAMAEMLGSGKHEPLTQMVGKAFLGYVPGYDLQPYNPDKAKKLLAEAGYPSGLRIPLFATERDRDIATAVQAFLVDVGFKVDLDIADYGRYIASVYGGTGWKGLAIGMSGINPSATDLFTHFGPNPQTFRFGIKKSPEYLAACDQALHTYDNTAVIAKYQAIVKQAGEDSMVIPLWRAAQAVVMQPYVHSNYMKIHTIIWNSYEDWMEKH